MSKSSLKKRSIEKRFSNPKTISDVKLIDTEKKKVIDALRKSENEEVSEEEFCEFLKTNVSMEEMKDLFRKSDLDEDLFYEYGKQNDNLIKNNCHLPKLVKSDKDKELVEKLGFKEIKGTFGSYFRREKTLSELCHIIQDPKKFPLINKMRPFIKHYSTLLWDSGKLTMGLSIVLILSELINFKKGFVQILKDNLSLSNLKNTYLFFILAGIPIYSRMTGIHNKNKLQMNIRALRREHKKIEKKIEAIKKKSSSKARSTKKKILRN